MPKRNDSSSPKSAQEPNLIVQHNLSADNLEHAHKLGGLAAPSIAVVNKDHGMNNFGEISLLAHHSLIDPKHVPVFDADVYSPRNPRPRYRVNEKSLKQFKAWLKPFADQTGAEHGLYNVADKVNERGHQEVLNDHDASNAMKLAWLHENGVQVPPVYRDVPATHPFAKMPAMQEFLAQHGVDHNARPGDKYYRDLSAAASKAIDQHGDQADDPEDAQHLKELHRDSVMDDDGQLYFGKVDRIFHDASAAGKQEVDQYAMHDAIGDKVKELGEDKFHAWAKPKLQPLEGEPYLPKGQRKMRYDLDAVLKEVTRKVRDAEGFNYGLGSARSNGAKKYRDIAGVQKDRHKIVSAEEFDAKKKVQDDEFGKLADKLAPYHSTNGGFGMMDALVGAIGDSYKRGKWLGSTLRENAFSGVPPHLQQELGDFANRLRQMPTQYFEAKPQRIVGLNEFKAAVVPHTTSPHILDLLRRNGINHVEKYQRRGTDADAIERAKATERVARAHDLLLSEPELVFDDLAKAEDEPGVALVTAYNDQGELLIGHRRDNGKWTLPGGHLNPGEDPRDGAERELYEETGLRPTSLSFFKEHTTDGGVKLYCFSAYVHGTPHSDFDPDEEVDEWKFVDVSDGLPSRFYNNMHGPEPESGDNIVANVFDIKKSERDESDLEKAERSLPADIGHSSVDESGVHFETGHPVSVKYVRGTTPAPNFGERFQQHIEPAGRYMVHSPDPRDPPKGWEKGEVHFKNPLVLHFNTSGQISYDEGSWKSRLHRALGATGPRLSRKIAALGHDGIVTTSDSGTHEIVDLTHLKKSEEDIEQPRWDNLTPDEAAEHAHGEGLAFEYSNPHSFTWRYDPKYPVANLSHIYHGTAKRWLSKERAGRLEEDPTDTYIDDLAHSMKSMPLGVAPIVVAHPSGNKPDLGDGYHRLAIAETSGITHTPAVVGTPKFDGIKKSEDEVGRLLDHPDPTERRMALRLSTTKAQHVIHAALDPDPSVHEAAIGHPLFGDVEGLYLTDAKEGHDGRYPAQQQLAFLARAARVKPFHISSVLRNAYSVSADAKNQILPAIIGHANLSPANVRMLYRGYGTTHEHRMAILDHPAVPIDVLEHALHGAMFCPGPQTEELAGKAAEHKNLSPEAREALVRQVGDASPPHVLEVAQRALAHGSVSRSLVDDLFARQMVGTPSANALIGAFLRGHSASP